MTDTTLGQRIAERRKMLGLSQEAFGEKMGVSRQAASKWESDAATPEIEKLIAMSKLFGVSMDWLLGMDETQSRTAAVPVDVTHPEDIPPQPSIVAVWEEEPLETEAAPPQPESRRRWPLAVCAGVTALCLILSTVFAVWGVHSRNRWAQSDQQLEDAVSRLDTMEAALQAQSDENIYLQDQIDTLHSENQKLSSQKTSLKNQLYSMQRQNLTLLDQLASNQDHSWQEQTFPGSGAVVKWAMDASAITAFRPIDLRFTCALDTTAEVEKAVLRARLNGETAAEAECRQYVVFYSAALELTAADGYQYDLILTYADGTHEEITLSESDFSMLQSGMQMRTMVTLLNNTVTCGGQKFWLTYSDVSVILPSLLSDDLEIQWSDMKLIYYYNGAATTQKEISPITSDSSQKNTRYLCFSTPTLTFTMPGQETGSLHEIWLEGTVTIDGAETPVQLLLTRCEMSRSGLTLSSAV